MGDEAGAGGRSGAIARRGTIVDGHMHTILGASDSSLKPEELLAEAERIGLTGINISEHDRVWESNQFERFRAEARERGIFICKGMEVSTDMGHIIAFGMDAYRSGIRSARRFREVADSIGAFITIAHPFRHYFDPVTFRRQGKEPFRMTPAEAAERMPIFQVVHGIEVGNGGNNRRENEFAYRVAQVLGKPMTGGSDAHSTSGIGIYTTVFSETLESERQLLDLLHAGQVTPYTGLNTGAFQPFVPEDDC